MNLGDLKFTAEDSDVATRPIAARSISIERANKILAAKLAKAPQVFGKLQDAQGTGIGFSRSRGPADQQKGRLVCIENLEEKNEVL